MPRARREDVYRFQAHALRHAVGQCSGVIHLAKHYAAELPQLLCPLCLGWFSLSEMDEDHAPQKAGQSAMGPAQVVVMTCRADNQRAGRTFEGTAHALGSVLTAILSPGCPVHQRQRTAASGLEVVTSRVPGDLTDVRAAYLIAFATLGYRWVLSGRLENLGRRLRDGDLRHAATDYEVLCLHDVGGLEPFHVYEIVEPVRAILVTGAEASVLLPCDTSPDDITGQMVTELSRLDLPSVRARSLSLRAKVAGRWSWPAQFVRPGGTPEKTWDDVESGNLFHYDRCDSAHALHAVPRHALEGIALPVTA